jgi:hypothetical protein
MFPTTPITVTHGNESAEPSLIRFPIGDAPGQICSAECALINTTRSEPARSAAMKSRPAMSGRRSVAKYPGVAAKKKRGDEFGGTEASPSTRIVSSCPPKPAMNPVE